MGSSPPLHRRLAAAPYLLLLLLLYLTAAARCQQNTTISFATFDGSHRSSFTITTSANIDQGALQLTPDNRANLTSLINSSGRVLLNTPFKLWEKLNSTTKHVASFTTVFTMNVFREPETIPGEGLAFLIAPNTDEPPPASDGGFLGLTNLTLDGSPSNHFIAVEFDTLKQTYDPDDNHVGLDINGVVSNTTSSLSRFGIEIAPVKPTKYNVWIDYDGAARYIRVYMALNGNSKPGTPVLNATLDLSDHLQQFSYFGFTGSTGSNFELNCILAWNLTIENLSSDDSGWPAWKWALAVGLPSLAVAAILGVVAGSYLRRRRGVRDDPNMAMTLMSLPGMPREFTFKELKRATNNFDDRLRLGQGGFGVVYKGAIAGDGGSTDVAVKKFSRDRVSGQEDFLAELTIINRLRHKHLVPLAGWCHENGVLLLVYDFMPNGSLDHHLFAGPERPILGWGRRYNIVAGLASALHYLHNEFDQKVVHRDLKASNVMLDAEFNARLGDFGLARAIETDKTSYTELELGGVPGTLGYIAPECFHTGKASRQSDVFGFGAVVIEVACGRRIPIRREDGGFEFLSDWVWKLHREGRILEAVDPRLEGDYVVAEAELVLLLGLACSHPIPSERPKMEAIVEMLYGSVAPPEVPAMKPAFVWPAGVAEDDEDRSSAAMSRMTSMAVTSSYSASSSGWTPHSLSVGRADTSMV